MGTEKQNKFALHLGIEAPENYDVKTLAKLIDEKMGKKPTQAPQTAQATSQTSTIINVNKRPNSIEIGKAGQRIKLYFEDVEDLKTQYNEYKEAGFIQDEVETIKL